MKQPYSEIIPIKCPYCHVGMKIDPARIPDNLITFRCPKCKLPIKLSNLAQYRTDQADENTVLLSRPIRRISGTLTILPSNLTPDQSFKLHEGVNIIGRKSQSSKASIGIITGDKQMSREHIKIEMVENSQGGYNALLSDDKNKNKTLFNNIQLEKGEIIVLKNGDEIVIGETKLRFNE